MNKNKEYFDPKTNKFPYTKYTDEHYLVVKKDNGLVYDENYPYLDNSQSFRFKKKMTKFLLLTIVFPLTRVKLGLKIEGKENLKKHKEELANGVISISNHIHMWDYLCVYSALRKYTLNVIVWNKNISGENGKMIRSVGGIPIPENNNLKAMKKYNEAIDEILNTPNNILHICAEGSMWEYYAPIRPFKTGAAHYAIKTNKPILPLGFSYRKPNWFRRLFKQIACFTLTVGEPIYPNANLDRSEAKLDLTVRAHDAVCRLAKIDPKKNIYPPVFDHNERIDYYTSTYGVGYKKGH